MIVLKPVRIDLARPARTVVHCMQTDNTQRVDVSLFVNNRPYDVTADVDSGTTVTMAVAYILPNGYGDQYTETALGETAVEQDSTIAHLYHVMIDGACTDVVGFAQIIVKFTTDGGQILNSFPLTLDVIKSQPDDVDPGGGSPATSRYLRKDLQTPATEDMTQPVGVTPEGLLVTAPGGGGGGGVSDPVRYNTTQSLTSTQKATARTNIGAGTYSKPSGGIPSTDMAQAVQTALTAAGTAVQPSALAAYISKAAQGNADNYSSALVVAPAGVDSNGAIKSPVAVYGTVTRSGSAGHYTYSANISATVLYQIQQVYPHMRAFLVDHEGRECTLIKPPASDQDSLVFYTLDKANKKIVYYTVSTSGATTVTEDAYNGDGEGGGTPTWEDIVPEDGIPQTDLAKETVTITAGSGTPVTYTSSKTFAEISVANAAGKLIVPVFKGFEGRCIDVGQNAATFEVIDATNPAAPVQYIFVVSATGCAGAAANWGSGGGGSGAELFEVTISVSGSVYSASETVADIMTAYQSGKLVKYYNESGAEGLLFATPTAYGITFVCFDDADGGHPTMMTIYSIAADGTVTVSSEDILNSLITPGAQTRTAAQMASGLLAISNVVYTITGDATGFVLTTSTNPISTAGECIEIRLTVGSTAITTPTWPSWCKLMNGWDGNFDANTYYDIIIDDAGNVYAGTREVSV